MLNAWNGHVSSKRVCDCRIFSLLSHNTHACVRVCVSHNSAKYAYCIFLPHKLAFFMAILILFEYLLPISTRFRYLDHLIANRMAPSMCPDPCGTRWGSWFQGILYHIFAYLRCIFGVYAVCIYFKWRIKLTYLVGGRGRFKTSEAQTVMSNWVKTLKDAQCIKREDRIKLQLTPSKPVAGVVPV